MPVRVVTDSASDLPPIAIDALGVTVVPLKIRFGDEEFVDGEELSVSDFWKRARSSSAIPATAAPPPAAFAAAFEQGDTAGVVCVHMSGKLSSGTQQAAHTAAVAAAVPVHLVDSGTVSRALGWAVQAAAEAARDGADAEAVAEAARSSVARAGLIATLDTLDFLRMGGRIGRAQAAFGTLLNVKPLITLADGIVEPAGRVRTRGKALDALLDRLPSGLTRVAVMHGDAPDAAEFAARLQAATGLVPEVDLIGPVIGSHTGPGVTAVMYLTG